jgi:AcrR family transcriptional regulator
MTIVTKANRGRPRTELKHVIYEAALTLFRERGFARTSVDDVVAAAGVAKGTFFNFFPSKLDVMKAYYAAIDVEVADCRDRMEPAAPLAALRAYAAEVEAILLREGDLMLELLQLTLADAGMRRIDDDSGAADSDGFAAYLVNIQATGRISASVDPVRTSAALVDLWAGAIRGWLVHPVAGALPEQFGWRVDLLFNGMGYRQ